MVCSYQQFINGGSCVGTREAKSHTGCSVGAPLPSVVLLSISVLLEHCEFGGFSSVRLTQRADIASGIPVYVYSFPGALPAGSSFN